MDNISPCAGCQSHQSHQSQSFERWASGKRRLRRVLSVWSKTKSGGFNDKTWWCMKTGGYLVDNNRYIIWISKNNKDLIGFNSEILGQFGYGICSRTPVMGRWGFILDGSDAICIYCHLEYLKETHQLEKSRNYLGLAGKVWCPQKTSKNQGVWIHWNGGVSAKNGANSWGEIKDFTRDFTPMGFTQMDGWMDG